MTKQFECQACKLDGTYHYLTIEQSQCNLDWLYFSEVSTCDAHLSREQIREIVQYLQEWLK